MTTTRAVVCCVLAAAAGEAQQMRQPVLGWMFDGRSGRIRAIAGVNGSAIVDEALAVEPTFRFAAVAPGGGFAVAESEESTSLVQWKSGLPSVSALEDALRHIDAIVFSPSGRAVVLRSGKQLQVWTGIPQNPGRLADVDDAEEVIAVADDGALALARGGLVSVREATGAETVAYEGGTARALAFQPSSRNLAIADEERGEVVLVDGGFVRTLSAASRPASLAFSADGEKLGIVSEQAADIVNLRTGEKRSITCACGVNVIERMQGNAVFRLGSAYKGAIRFLDGDASEPRLFVAPQMGGRQ